MNKALKSFCAIAGMLLLSNFSLWSCEPETDNLGAQFFQNGTANANQSISDVIGYNISNNDTIRTDAARLGTATLGAFNEPVFGMQKSSYVSQVRLSTYAPSFGTNAVADSAVLVIKPTYASDSLTTTTNSSFSYGTGTGNAKQVVNTYPITAFGKTKLNGGTKMTLKVYEVTDFLGTNDKIYSNKSVNTGTLLGSKTVGTTINSVAITSNADNSSLVNAPLGIRIPLNGSYFQNKIIAQASSTNLADAASFIRYLNGLMVSVDENDGYIFKFAPSDISLILYYKNDVTSGSTTTRTAQTYTFDMSPANNTYFNQIAYNRAGSTVASALASANTATGDSKLFAQGMGGPGFGLKIPATTIQNLQNNFNKNKAGIVSAKIRLYTDTSLWNNNYAKPTSFLVRQQNLYTYLDDMLTLSSAGYVLTRGYNLTSNPAYYDLSITQTLKNIVESNAANQDLIVNIGSYTTSSTGLLAGITSSLNKTQLSYSQYLSDRAYNPYRVVLTGTDPSNANRPQLIVTYGTK